ncbi:Protein maelstrom [Orchesella cincta]|uniref:Protein maelstrom n=1 Tax=Orchesella cincta TaxID=48709 RepID=A0A1D2N3K4_ORCCI|nr:Protein maelstrom [Orchesella cincta]
MDHPVHNTFGELVLPHAEAIENEYELYVSSFASVQQYLRRKDLANQPMEPTGKKFLILTMVPYCKHQWNELIPGEFAVTVFSIDKGIENNLVSLVDPGGIPLGERGEVSMNCERNALPTPGEFDGVDVNPILTKTVLRTIENAAKQYGCYMEGEILIFTMRAEIATLRNCIRWLERKFPAQKWGKFRIISLEMLLQAMSELVEDAGNNPAVITHEGGAARFLYHPRYEFNHNLACRWHQKKENVWKASYCALNIVMRRAYNALFYLHHLFEKKLKPNTHLPPVMKNDVVNNRSLRKQMLMSEQPVQALQEAMPRATYEMEENVIMFNAAEDR